MTRENGSDGTTRAGRPTTAPGHQTAQGLGPDADLGRSWQARRSELELIEDQLAAIDAYNLSQHRGEQASETVRLTREARLDASRRMEARRREHQALIARAGQQLEHSAHLLSSRAPVRAVLAHRNAWLRGKVVDRLGEAGVLVVGVFEDGADVVGTTVVEQPDLVLVEDRLPTMPGLHVVRRVREFSPRTLIAAQALDGSGVSALLDAGAHAVFTRAVPPADIADRLLEMLAGSSA